MAAAKKPATAIQRKKATTVPAPAPSRAVRVATPSAPKKSVKTMTAATRVGVKAAKPVVPPQAKIAIKPKTDKPVKVKKPKLVRDSFTIPKDEYAVLETLKQRAGQLSNPTKKSEMLRAGIKALAAMPDAAFLAALKVVPSIKTGRPAKD